LVNYESERQQQKVSNGNLSPEEKKTVSPEGKRTGAPIPHVRCSLTDSPENLGFIVTSGSGFLKAKRR
jgi:hypothetical protein